MKNLVLLLFLTSIIVSSYAQKLPVTLNHDTESYRYFPLCVLSAPGKPAYQSSNIYTLNNIPIDQILSINVLKDSTAFKTYGSKARYGVIIINLKKYIRIEFKNDNSISKILLNHSLVMNRPLPIYIDSVIVKHPEYVYLDPAKVGYVKIDTEKVSGIIFVNIVTKKQLVKPGEIMIRGANSF